MSILSHFNEYGVVTFCTSNTRSKIQRHAPTQNFCGTRALKRLNYRTLSIYGGPKKGHTILPANDCFQLSYRRIEHWQCGSITKAPNEPLRCSWHQLAVLPKILASGIEQEHCAVEGSPASFDTSHDDRHFVPACQGC